MSGRATIANKTSEAAEGNPIPKPIRTGISQPTASSVRSTMFLQQTIGNRVFERLYRSGLIQAKLTIGAPNDVYEQEADQVADQVMRMPEPAIQAKPG
jgi:hypothetical protein